MNDNKPNSLLSKVNAMLEHQRDLHNIIEEMNKVHKKEISQLKNDIDTMRENILYHLNINV